MHFVVVKKVCWCITWEMNTTCDVEKSQQGARCLRYDGRNSPVMNRQARTTIPLPAPGVLVGSSLSKAK